MLIREMRSKDLDLVVEFEIKFRDLGREITIPFKEEEYRKKFSKRKIEDYINSKSLLCIENNIIIGKIDLLIEISLSSFKKVGYIDWITVLKTYRNKGIAKSLLLEAEKHFREENCELFYLFVDDTDIAKGFYDHIGLKQEKVTRGYKLLN